MSAVITPQAPATPAPRKVLGFSALFAASIGVIVAQLGMVALMQGVGIGGWGFFAALGDRLSRWRWPTPWPMPRWR